MKILVFSDSHSDTCLMRKATLNHPEAQVLIHAGDYARDMNCLMSYNRQIYRVKGNCDAGDPFEEELLLEFEGVRILLCHGHLYSVKYTTTEIAARAAATNAAAVIFGHTHKSLITSLGGILLFNPGAAGVKKRSDQASYGILEVKNSQIASAKIRGETEN